MSKDSYVIVLPWPSKDLSPNARVHWAVKHRAASKARIDAQIACLASGARKLNWKAVEAHWTFYPPTAHSHDDDNLVSRCKSSRDGVAQTIGIDDANWHTAEPVIASPVDGGYVKLVIRARDKAEEGN